MLRAMSFNEFVEFSQTGRRIGVFREMMADRLTPIGILESLADEMKDGAILESGVHHDDAGRYSYITFGTIAQLTTRNNTTTITRGGTTTSHLSPPFGLLRQLMTELTCVSHPDVLKFMGCTGFLSYDAARLFEDIPDRHRFDQALPEMHFNFYETILLFDHSQQTLCVITTVEVDHDFPHRSYQMALDKIDSLVQKITVPTATIKPMRPSPAKLAPTVTTDVEDGPFMELVELAKSHIQAGDAFQIVLSRCFKQNYTVPPLDIYRALRRVSPSPYMFYFPFANDFILGASPEKLISVAEGRVTINPIAGTLKRTAQSDNQQIANDLLTNDKEKAEHMMLVDLARNDLGAVCRPGTMKVDDLLKVKHFSHVSHITSVVSGQLQHGKDALDALAAAFPAGTLSGAPKIRAMQIIDALESSRRQLYGGAICRLNFQGNMDSCIAIRMAHLTNGTAVVRAGAGVVYDSLPRAEADETRHKARAIIEAIALAEAGLL